MTEERREIKRQEKLVTQVQGMRAEKDVAEKALEDHEDVFADIINMILFSGENRVTACNLDEIKRTSVYNGKRSLRFQERDIAKLWHHSEVQVVYLGLENETEPEKDMPLRVMGYDGAAYRDQMYAEKGQNGRLCMEGNCFRL